MTCLQISWPSAGRGLGFGIGGAGGSGRIPFPTEHDFDLSGDHVTAAVSEFTFAGIAGSRTFIIAGIQQLPIAPGIVLLPTSEDHALTASNYIIGSSQYYTVGAVHWNGVVKTQGTDWEYFQPANHPRSNHIIHILTPGTVSTNITLVFYRWDITVRSGFKVNSNPVPFGFTGTSIVAERVPPLGEFFHVEYTSVRPGDNPRTMFCIFENMVDDILTDHTLYDNLSGFQTFRPDTYKVFDTFDNHVWEWIAPNWVDLGPFSLGTFFYVKRTKQVIHYNAFGASIFYTAGDGSSSLVEVISDNDPFVYPLYGDSIAYNFLEHAFEPGALSNWPSAYEVAQHPGDYDPWVPGIDS